MAPEPNAIAAHRVAQAGFRSLEEEQDEGNDRKEHPMCLTCGCMQAHLQMGEHNIRFEDVKAAADENGRTVAETIDIIDRTWAADREAHAAEYQSE